jgi:hypothetical protein
VELFTTPNPLLKQEGELLAELDVATLRIFPHALIFQGADVKFRKKFPLLF